MNITTDFILFAIFLIVILIAADILFLRLRKNSFDEGKPFSAFAQKYVHRFEEWIRNIKALLPKREVQVVSVATLSEQTDSSPTVAETTLITEIQPEVTIVQSAGQENPPATGNTIRVQITADIPEGTIVHITLQAENGKGRAALWHETLQSRPSPFKRDIVQGSGLQPVFPSIQEIGKVLANPREWPAIIEKLEPAKIQRGLFIAAIVLYLLLVSIGIDRFPIYFFTDEAVHTNLAANFWDNGLKNNEGELLPTYFSIDPSFGLNGVSIYLQVIPYALFGKSLIVTRMVSALVTLLGAILIGLLLKQVFKIEAYWLGVLLLITSPAWFLHARTAFEYMEVAAFFAAMLYFYNRYRQGDDKYLYATVIAAALTFYTHGLGQVLVALTTVLLFLSDFRYHFQPERRKTLLFAAGLAVLLFLPYVRYNLSHSSTIGAEIRQRGSYWVNNNFSLKDKIVEFVSEYFYGLNPLFWFMPSNTRDLPRHIMKGYGNILLPLLPFALLGIVRAIKNFRKSEYRSVIIALLVSPMPAAIVAIGTPRTLWMIVPWAISIALGLDWSLHWLDEHTRLKKQFAAVTLFVLFSIFSIFMLSDALRNGPTWFQDYGLYGMQYGAKQLFVDTVIPELQIDPNINFMISPSWANGTGELANFFFPRDLINRMRFGTPNDLLNNPEQLTQNTIFVLTPDEFTNFSNDEKIKEITVRETIPYPNGKPGFYLATIQYADNIDQLMAVEHDKLRAPVEDKVTINDQTIRILHSPIGSGNIWDTFDDNPDTLTRVAEANPYIFDLYPDPPLVTNSVIIQTGSLPNFTVNVSLYAPGATEPVQYTQTFTGLPPDPLVTINFDKGPAKSARIYIEIKDNTSGETSQIHVRTIQFK